MTLAAVMLGSAAVSAGCCVAPRADASLPARILAGAMVAVMAAVILDAPPVVQRAGALLLIALAGLVVGGTAEGGLELAWHRAAGATVMALAVLMPQHGPSMSTQHMAVGAAMAHGATALQGTDHSLRGLLLHAATAAYLCWVAAAVVRLRNRPITDLLRWEHLAMGASLAVMIFFMN